MLNNLATSSASSDRTQGLMQAHQRDSWSHTCRHTYSRSQPATKCAFSSYTTACRLLLILYRYQLTDTFMTGTSTSQEKILQTLTSKLSIHDEAGHSAWTPSLREWTAEARKKRIVTSCLRSGLWLGVGRLCSRCYLSCYSSEQPTIILDFHCHINYSQSSGSTTLQQRIKHISHITWRNVHCDMWLIARLIPSGSLAVIV